MSRYNTYKNYLEYKQDYNNKSIDELCKKTNKFELQPQQLFLKKYFNNNINNIKQFLLFHEIGSGKTCTSIILAEDYLKINNKYKIIIILPARLKNNFYDELISPCTNFKYFTEEEYNIYNNDLTDINTKIKLKKKFISEINKNYTIISYDKFRLMCLKNSNNILDFIKKFTENKMIIVDELHNVISDTYNIDNYIQIEETGKLTNLKSISINSSLMKLLSKFSHNNSKFIFLTATPIYDSFKELPELVYLLNPSFDNIKENLNNINYKSNLEKLRGKISYFSGSSKNAYPKSNLITHEINMSNIQDTMTYEALNSNKFKNTANDYEEEAFLANQRQIGISCLSKKYNINTIINNLKLYAPKLYKLTSIINSPNIYGKHVVYTSFVNVGINVIEQYLVKNGWKSIFDVYENNVLWNSYENKIYAIWSGNETDKKKDIIKKIINSENNIYGNKLKLLIGSPSIKEGISFKHIQHIHLIDPVWNIAGKNQIEGRAIRFCSHYDIDEKVHINIKRIINIHIYKLIPSTDKKKFITETVDQKLYDKILPEKYKNVDILLNKIKEIAIDHHLFKKINNPNAESPNSSRDSTIDDDDKKYTNKKKKSTKQLTCMPKIRRPNKITKECSNPLYPFKKLNKHKTLCCYKNNSKIKTTCPKKRRPNSEGNCDNYLFKRKNKNGDDCCYKFDKK